MLDEVFLKSDSSREILNKLYRVKNALDRKMSLAFIAKQTKLPSKNYYSDIISGRRKLPEKFIGRICEFFKLNPTQSKVLRLMVAMEKKKSDKVKLQNEINILRQILIGFDSRNSPVAPTGKGQDLFRAFKVLCAIHSFENPPTLKDLQQFFPSSTAADLETALAFLREHGFIEPDRNAIAVKDDFLVFKRGKESFSHFDGLEAAIMEAKECIPVHYGKSETAHFQAVTFNVDKTEFEKKFPEFILKFRELQHELFRVTGKTLIQSNLQIYPTIV